MRASVIMLLSLGLSAPPGIAATYWINPEGTGDFPTIQAAIDAAVDGDIIELADGTFRGEGNYGIDYLGKTITVRSASGWPYRCIIDCEEQARGFTFQSAEPAGTALLGVTVTRGRAGTLPYDPGGGGFCCVGGAMPTIANCVFRDNRAYTGGGAYVSCADPVIEDCVFSANGADTYGGGGLYLEHAQLTVRGCSFILNTAPGCGGGVRCCVGTTGCIFEDCSFISNQAGCHGGGVRSCRHITLEHCVFRHNVAAEEGGGLGLLGDGGVVTSCTFYANAGSLGGGICSFGPASVSGTIISHSSTGPGIALIGGSAEIACTDIYGNAGGDWVGGIEPLYGVQGNICEDPLYCDPEAGDLTLHSTSPCAPFSAPNPECDLIGALPVSCGPTSHRRATWGGLKALYRGSGGGE